MECKICHSYFKNSSSLSGHLKGHKLTAKEYYDKFFKKLESGVCLSAYCNKETNFVSVNYGYTKFCSYSCNSKNNIEKLGTCFNNKEFHLKNSENRKGKSNKNKGKTYEDIYGVEMAGVLRKKRSELHKNKIVSKDTCLKISQTKISRQYKCSEENRKLNSIRHKGKITSEKTKIKQRVAAIKQLQEKYRDGFSPNYNKKACQYFNQLMIQNKTIIQHAENGGEYYIEELGYWLDGYDRKNNIAYEFDEKRKYSNSKLKDKHIIRQQQIEKYLRCEFIRIKEI